MSTVLRRIRAGWTMLTGTGAGASAVLALLAVACVFVAVAAPRASLGFRTGALQRVFSTTTAEDRSVVGVMDYGSLFSGLAAPGAQTSQVFAPDIEAVTIGLARHLTALRLPLQPAGSDWSGLASGYAVVSGAAPRAYNGGIPPQMEILFRDKLGRFAQLAEGSMPGRDFATADAGRFQVAVTPATAARFGLHVGSRRIPARRSGPQTLTPPGLPSTRPWPGATGSVRPSWAGPNSVIWKDCSTPMRCGCTGASR